eukprot:6273050-Pyramimonas_sp.AAC.1
MVPAKGIFSWFSPQIVADTACRCRALQGLDLALTAGLTFGRSLRESSGPSLAISYKRRVLHSRWIHGRIAVRWRNIERRSRPIANSRDSTRWVYTGSPPTIGSHA